MRTQSPSTIRTMVTALCVSISTTASAQTAQEEDASLKPHEIADRFIDVFNRGLRGRD